LFFSEEWNKSSERAVAG